MTTAAAGPDDLAPALAELEADGRAYVLEYLAGAARANLEVRLALARALAAEARTAPLRRLEAGHAHHWRVQPLIAGGEREVCLECGTARARP